MITHLLKEASIKYQNKNSVSDTLEAISLTTPSNRSSKSIFLNAIGCYFEFSALKVQDANSKQKVLK